MKLAAALAAALMASVAAPALAQAPASRTAAYKAPRNAYGQPDLTGTWSNATLTPLERPANLGTRAVMTPAEVAAIETAEVDRKAKDVAPTDPNVRTQDLPKDCGRGFTGTNCGYNGFWTDAGDSVMRVRGEPRTSIIVKPANGRFPALTAAGRERMARRAAMAGPQSFANPENRSLGERCIMSFGSSAGPPMTPLLYNNTYEIVQNADEVAIVVEMVHDVRHIRLNAKHDPSGVRRWMGDSVGRWEGDTLVIETINQRPEQSFRGMVSPNAKVIERLTRVSPTELTYSFTVEDPEIFTEPFTGELAMRAVEGPIYEYACHEGNHALPGILAGAREDEKNGRIPNSSGEADKEEGE